MDKELMARAGCMESDSPAAQIEKMAGYIRKMEDEGRKKDEEQAMARQKMQAMESDMDAMKRAMESKPFEGKETKEEEKKEREAMSRRLSALEEKNSMYVREIADLKARSTAADDLVGKAKDREAKEFAQDAIAMGRIRGDHKGDIQKTTEWLAGKYKADKDGAEDILSAAGTFQPDERAAMSRLGAKPRDERDNDGDSLDAQTDRAISDAVKELRAKGEQPTTAQAMSRAREKNPDLFKQWERRPGGQLA